MSILRTRNSDLVSGEEGDKRRVAIGLLDWTNTYRPLLAPDIPFDLESHRYLKALYEDESRYIVVKKASQMGVSEWAVSRALWSCDYRDANVFYVMPTLDDVYDFSQMRLNSISQA